MYIYIDKALMLDVGRDISFIHIHSNFVRGHPKFDVSFAGEDPAVR